MTDTNVASSPLLRVVSRFLDVASRLSTARLLQEPHYRQVASELLDVTTSLMRSNQGMAGWIQRFWSLDSASPNLRQMYFDVAGEYRTNRSGAIFYQMKFDCYEIGRIYTESIMPHMAALMEQDSAAVREVTQAFDELSEADTDLSDFIERSVLGTIDDFLAASEHLVRDNRPNEFYLAQLDFMTRASPVSECLIRLAGGLANLMTHFAQLAHRPVGATRTDAEA